MDSVIVVPCFNEASRWDREYWRRMLSVPGVAWVFVDDGSSDRTALLIDQMRTGTTAELLALPENVGKAEAVRRGMLMALTSNAGSVPVVGFMDADGAFGDTDVRRLTELCATQRHDAVWSARVLLAGRNIKRSTLRHFLGRAVATFVSIGHLETPYDTQSGFKLFAASPTLRDCLIGPFRTRWLFELELLNRWHRATGRQMQVWEEPLLSWRDVAGSKITLREAVRIARELVFIKRDQRRAKRSAQRKTSEGGPVSTPWT